MERAEVAVLVIDGSQSISEQDMRIIQTVRDSGRALVICFNKWDLVDDERRYYLEREYERELVQVQWAPRINVTARTGWHIDRLVPAIEAALGGLGDPDLHRHAERLPRPPGRRAPAPGARRQAAADPVRHPGPDLARRRSRCSPPASSTPGTSASSSVGCARSSGSSVRRSRSRCGRGRSASADPGNRDKPVSPVTMDG